MVQVLLLNAKYTPFLAIVLIDSVLSKASLPEEWKVRLLHVSMQVERNLPEHVPQKRNGARPPEVGT
jgi:hypothetical protein